ncbi:MAG: DUF4349 domain-containing protein [Chloroflexi bacterium]|nr:DUF4349 domain-containing protein [Chloroflexota bacterium]
MSKRNPWMISLYMLLIAGFIFTIVLLRSAPVRGLESRGERVLPPGIVANLEASYHLERPTTSLARSLGFVQQSYTSSFESPRELLPDNIETESVEDSRLVIYTIQTSLVVSNVERALAQIENLTSEASGYVVSSNTQWYGDSNRAKITIRVPSEQLDDIRDRLRTLALEVRNETKSGQDVTEEYVDVGARLRVLEAAERELLELYETRQESGDISDILDVYEELVSFREQIDSLTGQMQYLEQSAALATITIELVPDELARPIQVTGWRPQGTVRAAFEALLTALQLLADAIIWFCIYTAPQILLVIALVYTFWRLAGRHLFGKIKGMNAQRKELLETGNSSRTT